MEKCSVTGKAIFTSLLEARIVMFNLKWRFKRNKDEFGKRIKHRQGRPVQRRAYYCTYCQGYHVTKWTEDHFISYQKKLSLLMEKESGSGWSRHIALL